MLSFVIGPSGKHGLESICTDFKIRNISTMHYAQNMNPSAVHVNKDSFTIEYFQANEQSDYEKLYEFCCRMENHSLNPLDQVPER